MESKYHARKVEAFGKTFDSKHEADRYGELLLLQRAGRISGLECQKKFELIPAQYVNGKCVERACNYLADFCYTENGHAVVEDTKGFLTKDYVIKRKLMLYRYGIQINEIRATNKRRGRRRGLEKRKNALGVGSV